MATKSKHRKNHKAKVQARNNQKKQEQQHHVHRLNKMFAQMLEEQAKAAQENASDVTDVALPETETVETAAE